MIAGFQNLGCSEINFFSCASSEVIIYFKNVKVTKYNIAFGVESQVPRPYISMHYILDSVTVIDSLDKLPKVVSNPISRYSSLEILYLVFHTAILEIVKY